ncbi:MAG: fibronectin type III domain-containing protein [Planctomycetota bacterium]
MPTLTSKEADILALARQMIAGYQSHPADFPSSNWVLLNVKRIIYANARKAQIDARSQLKLATENKNASLNALRLQMKNCLKKSHVDASSDPYKLGYIGWGPKAPPVPVNPPGQPRNLTALNQGPDSVALDWKPPAPGSGGPVRTYVIEQRNQPQGGGDFGDWQPVDTALETKALLTGQQRSIQLEYRVKAINTGGESPPSNTAAVVL